MSTWHHVFRLSPVAALMLFSGMSTPVAAQSAPPPPATAELDVIGRTLRNASLTYYPTPDPDAQTDTLSLNTQVTIAQTVEGDDGETWYRTADGDYLPEAAVRLPRTPPRAFAGRW